MTAESRAGKERSKGVATPQEVRGRPFPRGKSGNPAGRPVGALNRSSRIAALLLEGESEALARKAIDLALAGDVAALRVCIERLIPPARERAVTVTLPPLREASDLPAISAAIVARVASGELLPAEGAALAGLVSAWRESVEFSELERRIAALESA